MRIENLLQSAIGNGWIPSPERDLTEHLQGLDPYLKQVLTALTERVQTLGEIGAALTAEHDLQRLLEMIVEKGCQVTRADGGTLYLLDNDAQELHFEIILTRSREIKMGGATGRDITWNAIPMFTAPGVPNHRNVSTYVAHTGEVVNIKDVYNVEGFDFTGTKQFDQSNHYRSQSMLVCPLKNHEDRVIGVIQLLNAMDEDGNTVISFSGELEKLITALASQAAIAITNTMLLQELKDLFDSLIQVIATAVDEKSPYTSGHITRVTELTMAIAREINKQQSGKFAEISFSPEELEELRIAAWLHDIGKIVTPEYIMDKSTKLETICDRIEAVNLRYEIIKRDQEIAYLRHRLEKAGMTSESEDEEELRNAFSQMESERTWINRINAGGTGDADGLSVKIDTIADRTFLMEGKSLPLLQPDELENLKIKRGTLNDTERKIIENHVVVTRNMLRKLSFPSHLVHVPEYAGGHHEKIDGSGYPEGLSDDEIPLQARIMALADIFEALTAEDRPYKNGKKLSEAIEILTHLVKERKLDSGIFQVFVKSSLIREYAMKHVQPPQRDCLEYDESGKALDG